MQTNANRFDKGNYQNRWGSNGFGRGRNVVGVSPAPADRGRTFYNNNLVPNRRVRSISFDRRPRSVTRTVVPGASLGNGLIAIEAPLAKKTYFVKEQRCHVEVAVIRNTDYLRNHLRFLRSSAVEYVDADFDNAEALSKQLGDKMFAFVVEHLDKAQNDPSCFAANDAVKKDIESKDALPKGTRAPAGMPRVEVVVPVRQPRRRNRRPNAVANAVNVAFTALLFMLHILTVFGDYRTLRGCPGVERGASFSCIFPSLAGKEPRNLPSLPILLVEQGRVYGPFLDVHGKVHGTLQTGRSSRGQPTVFNCTRSVRSKLGGIFSGDHTYATSAEGLCLPVQAPPITTPDCPSQCGYDSDTGRYKCADGGADCAVAMPTGRQLIGDVVRHLSGSYIPVDTGESGVKVAEPYCFAVSNIVSVVPCREARLLPAEVPLGEGLQLSRRAFVGNFVIVYSGRNHSVVTVNDRDIVGEGSFAVIIRNTLSSDVNVKVSSQQLGSSELLIPADVKKFGKPPSGGHICEYSSKFQWTHELVLAADVTMCEPFVYDADKRRFERFYDVPILLTITPASRFFVAFDGVTVRSAICDGKFCSVPDDVYGRVVARMAGVALDIGDVVGDRCAKNTVFCQQSMLAAVAWLPLAPTLLLLLAMPFVSVEMSYRLLLALLTFVLTVPPASAALWRIGIYFGLGGIALALCLVVNARMLRRPFVFAALVAFCVLLMANTTLAEYCTGIRCAPTESCLHCFFDDYHRCYPGPPKSPCPLGTYDLAPPMLNETFCRPVIKDFKVLASEFWRFSWRAKEAELCAPFQSSMVAHVGNLTFIYRERHLEPQAGAPSIPTRARPAWWFLSWFGPFWFPAAFASQDVVLPAAVGSCINLRYTNVEGTAPISVCVTSRVHSLILHHVYDAVDCAFQSNYQAHCNVNYGAHPCERYRQAMADKWTGCLSVYHHTCKACGRDYLAKPCWTIPKQNMRNYFYKMSLLPDTDVAEIHKFTGVVDSLALSINGTIVHLGRDRIWTNNGRMVELVGSAMPLVLPITTLVRFDNAWYVSAIDSSVYDPNGLSFCLRNVQTKTLSYDEKAYREALANDLGYVQPKRIREKFTTGSLDAVPFENYMSHGCRPVYNGSRIDLESCQSGLVSLRLSGNWISYSTQEATVDDLVANPLRCLSTMSYALVELTMKASRAGVTSAIYEPDVCSPALFNVEAGPNNKVLINCRTEHKSVAVRLPTLSTRFVIECVQTKDIERDRYDVVRLNASHSLGLADAAQVALAMWRDTYVKWIYVGVSVFFALVFLPVILFVFGKIRVCRNALLLPETYTAAVTASKSEPRTRIRPLPRSKQQ